MMRGLSHLCRVTAGQLDPAQMAHVKRNSPTSNPWTTSGRSLPQNSPVTISHDFTVDTGSICGDVLQCE